MDNIKDKIDEGSKYLKIYAKCDEIINGISRLNISDLEKTKLKNQVLIFRSELSVHSVKIF